MWNCRKSVLLPAKRRKAGARPRARVTSRRELGRERSEGAAGRDGPSLPRYRQRAAAAGLWDPLLSCSSLLPRLTRVPPQQHPAAGLCASRAARPGSWEAPRPTARSGPEAGGTRQYPAHRAPPGQVQQRRGNRSAQRPAHPPAPRGTVPRAEPPGTWGKQEPARAPLFPRLPVPLIPRRRRQQPQRPSG